MWCLKIEFVFNVWGVLFQGEYTMENMYPGCTAMTRWWTCGPGNRTWTQSVPSMSSLEWMIVFMLLVETIWKVRSSLSWQSLERPSLNHFLYSNTWECSRHAHRMSVFRSHWVLSLMEHLLSLNVTNIVDKGRHTSNCNNWQWQKCLRKRLALRLLNLQMFLKQLPVPFIIFCLFLCF